MLPNVQRAKVESKSQRAYTTRSNQLGQMAKVWPYCQKPKDVTKCTKS